MRLIVQRERERMVTRAATYWDLMAVICQAGRAVVLTRRLVSVDGRRIPRAKDFDAATGQLKDTALLWLDGPAAEALAERLRQTEFRVTALEVKPFTEKPKAPFTTSTLQQEANRKLGFTARRTMNAAQSLYENGFITYMRTDSTTLAEVAVKAARQLVRSEYGAGVPVRHAASLHVESQECPGGPRGDSARRCRLPLARIAQESPEGR